MPVFTLGEIMSNATTRMGRRADIAESDASFWANTAIQEIARAAPQSVLETQTFFSVNSGDSLLTLPSDFYEPISLSFETTATSSNKTLVQTSPAVADACGYYPVGQPERYFIFGSQIQLQPRPIVTGKRAHRSRRAR